MKQNENEIEDFNILSCPKLKRSTQQYCKKCKYMCSEYGLTTCPQCNEPFDEHWTICKTTRPIKTMIKRLKTF